MYYPTEREILQFSANLAPQLLAELKPLEESAQREYRRARRQHPEKYELQIDVLRRHEAAVFRLLTAKLLKNRPVDSDAFRRAISADDGAFERVLSRDGGTAHTAYWCAHRLYNLIEGGRMLAIWCREIAAHLAFLICEAEDLWYDTDLVVKLKGWEEFMVAQPVPNPVPDAASAPPSAPQQPADAPEDLHARRARARQAFVEPILAQKGWSRLEFASEAEVDYKTVVGFLAGGGAYISTRLKLANALGVPIEELPE